MMNLVPKSVEKEANNRNMIYIDATCPLVSKVHNEAERHFSKGRQMIMIGHKGHPETVGTMGQLPIGEVLLVETIDDVQKIKPKDIMFGCTGTIGEIFPEEKIKNNIFELVDKIKYTQNKYIWMKAALGIMTTDTQPKMAILG